MKNKVLKNLKSIMQPMQPSVSIQPFRLKLAHVLLLAALGLLLLIPSAITLINTAVPLAWERAEGVVSTAAQDESNGGSGYIVTVIYRLSGETFNTRVEHTGDKLSRDDQVVIYYNPTNPKEAVIQNGGPFSFLAWIPFIAGLAILGITVFKLYLAWRRNKLRKSLMSSGKSIPALVKGTEIKKDRTLIQKVLYKRYIFFKLKAAPEGVSSETSEDLFVSDLYMWRGRMYGDVDRLKEDNTQVTIYQDEMNPKVYHFELPNMEPEESLPKESEQVDGEQPVETYSALKAGAGFTSIEVPELISTASSDEAEEAPVAGGLIPDGEKVTSSVDSIEGSSAMSSAGIDDGLAIEDIDQLEKSLAGINAAPAAIDLNFADDPENINNQALSPAPLPAPTPTVAPMPLGDISPINPSPVVESSNMISGISSMAGKESPSGLNVTIPSSSAPSYSNPEIDIKPITSIGESISSAQPVQQAYVAPVAPLTTPAPTPAPIQTPVPTPAPALSREEVSSAIKNERKISVPRR